MKRFLVYLLRWQLSTPIIALVTYLIVEECGALITAIIANLIGGVIFYKIDKLIFSDKHGKRRTKENP